MSKVSKPTLFLIVGASAIAFVLFGTLVLVGLSSLGSPDEPAPSAMLTAASDVPTPDATAIPAVEGMRLDQALADLRDAGLWDIVWEDESSEGRIVVDQTNWTVTRVVVVGDEITLKVLKTEELNQPTPSETTEAAPSEDLAQRVDAELKTQLGISEYSQMPDSDWVPYIASIEQVSSMTVVVTLQLTNVDDAYLEGVALKVMNLVGGNVSDVEWVQVNSADGNTGQVNRADAPALQD